MTTIGNNSPSIQQQRISTELGKATKSLQMGINELVDRFDTRAGEQLFRSFGLTVSLQGADAGQRFLKDNAGSIGQLPTAQKAAFSSLMSDANEVAALRAESTRLANLPSLAQLLSQIG